MEHMETSSTDSALWEINFDDITSEFQTEWSAHAHSSPNPGSDGALNLGTYVFQQLQPGHAQNRIVYVLMSGGVGVSMNIINLVAPRVGTNNYVYVLNSLVMLTHVEHRRKGFARELMYKIIQDLTNKLEADPGKELTLIAQCRSKYSKPFFESLQSHQPTGISIRCCFPKSLDEVRVYDIFQQQ